MELEAEIIETLQKFEGSLERRHLISLVGGVGSNYGKVANALGRLSSQGKIERYNKPFPHTNLNDYSKSQSFWRLKV